MKGVVKRIFLIGSPGSGKTTLARKLSVKLGCPHYALDDIRHPQKGIKRNDTEAKSELSKIIHKPSWIMEGIYVSWTKEVFEKADLIIWLDISYQTALFRVIWRYIKNLIRGNIKHGFKSTLILIKNLTRYHYPKPGTEFNDEDEYVTSLKTAHVLSHHKKKVLHIKGNEDLEKFLDKLKST